jgi:hypothetical protein
VKEARSGEEAKRAGGATGTREEAGSVIGATGTRK